MSYSLDTRGQAPKSGSGWGPTDGQTDVRTVRLSVGHTDRWLIVRPTAHPSASVRLVGLGKRLRAAAVALGLTAMASRRSGRLLLA